MHTPNPIPLMLPSLVLCVSMFVGCSSTPDKPDDALVSDTTTTTTKKMSVEQLVKNGDLALSNNRYKDAVALYKRALAIRPNQWQIHHNMAIAQSHIPNFRAAIVTIKQAMDQGGEQDARVWFTLGNLYQNRGLYEESIQAYRASLSLDDSPNVDTLVNISAAYTFLYQYDNAQKTLDYLLTLAPRDPRVHHNIAFIQHLQKNYKEAETLYDYVHELDPTFSHSYLNHADMLRINNQCSEAVPLYNKYTEVAPNGPYSVQVRTGLTSCTGK